MNKLRTDLTQGQIVVDQQGKLWKVNGGFGMIHSSNGSALYARRVDGLTADLRYDIARVATPEETELFKTMEPTKNIERLQANVESKMSELEAAKKELDEYRKSIE